jgi:putative phosphoesterase
MKLALLGDIHGNHQALEAVLSAASNAGVEQLLVTGDLVGYYYHPARVMDLLHPWKKYIVKGNHENMLEKARLDSNYLEKVVFRYGSGLAVAIEQLSKNQLDELCYLPLCEALEIDGFKIYLCHGAPWSNEQYVYPDASDDLLARCALDNFNLIVMGHTHYPMQKKIGNTLLINPGSVGQPRNRKPGAHWAMFDTMSGCVNFYNEPYDSSSLEQECQSLNPSLPYLVDVLKGLN